MLDQVRKKLQHYGAEHQQPLIDEAMREAAVLIALTQSADPSMVFIKRAEHVSSHKGQVAFPGGMWEPQDASLLETALRESEEEIALPRSEVEVVASLRPRKTRFAVRVSPFVGFIPENIAFIPEEAELDSVFTVPLQHLLTPENYGRAHFDTHIGEYEAPCIFFEDYRIWGFTFGILMDVLDEVFDFKAPIKREFTFKSND